MRSLGEIIRCHRAIKFHFETQASRTPAISEKRNDPENEKHSRGDDEARAEDQQAAFAQGGSVSEEAAQVELGERAEHEGDVGSDANEDSADDGGGDGEVLAGDPEDEHAEAGQDQMPL